MYDTSLSKRVLQYIIDNNDVNYNIPDIGDIMKSFHYDFQCNDCYVTTRWSVEEWEEFINTVETIDSPYTELNRLASYIEQFIDAITDPTS